MAGAALVGVGLVASVRSGWLFLEYLVLGLPTDVVHGTADLASWLGAVYGIEILLVMLTGIGLLARQRWSRRLAVTTAIFTWIVAGTWLAVGDWPWQRLINRGSAQPTLMLGHRVLAAGDFAFPRYQVQPSAWAGQMAIATAVAALVLVLLVRSRGPAADPNGDRRASQPR